MLHIAIVVYAGVLLAEAGADRTTCTAMLLSTRYCTAVVWAGMSLAFTIKGGVAVFVGHLLGKLPPFAVAAAATATFVCLAVALWRGRREEESAPMLQGGLGRGVITAFLAILLSEWADFGQLATAAFSAQLKMPLLVWSAATAALVTKGAVATLLGRFISSRVKPIYVRAFAGSLALLLAAISVAHAFHS
jgi:putative Ca2+/H+ antiporter (TMEM165/GDT1 family)